MDDALIPKYRHKSTLHLILMICNIALSSFYFGYLNNYFSTLPIETMVAVYHIPLSLGAASGIVNGIAPFSSIIGAAATFQFITQISRRHILLRVNCIAIFAGIIIYVQQFFFLMLARILQGLCVGCYLTMSPLIIRQLAPTEIAGRIGSIHQIFLISGIVFASVFQYILSSIFEDPTSQHVWPYIFAVPTITTLIQTINLLYVFPYETPRYHITKGQKEEARQLLRVIYHQQFVQEVELQKMQDLRSKKAMDASLNKKGNVSSQGPSIWKKLRANGNLLAFYVTFAQQISGLNPISLYGCQIARQSISSIRDLVPSLINSIQLCGTLLSPYTLHNYGRKQLLQKGNLALGISTLTVTIGLAILKIFNGMGIFMMLTGLCLFSFSFGASVGPTTFIYMAQVADLQILPYGICLNRFIGFVQITLFPYLTMQVFNNDPTPLFVFFTVAAFAICPFHQRWLVQTRNKQQHQIRSEVAKIQFCK